MLDIKARSKESHLKAMKKSHHVMFPAPLDSGYDVHSYDTRVDIDGYNDLLIGLKMKMIGRAFLDVCFFIGNSMVSWAHQEGRSMCPSSTAQSEFIVIGCCYTHLMWMKHILEHYGFQPGMMNFLL